MQNASLALLSDVNANKNIKPYGKLQIAYAPNVIDVANRHCKPITSLILHKC